MTVHRLSCYQCRVLKIKCDRSVPRCYSCTKKGKVCEFPNLFRNHTLVLLTRELRNRQPNGDFYYGKSSSNILERILSVKAPKQEPETPKLHSLPRVTEGDDAYNISILRLLVGQLQKSLMALFYKEFVNAEEIADQIQLHSLVDTESMVLILGVVLVANRYLKVIPEHTLMLLKSHMVTLLEECPHCPAKVSVMILLMEFFYCRFAINSAYRYLFLAASDCYALGLHELSSPLWTVVAFYDSIICSSVGRPTAIGKNFLPTAAESAVGRAMVNMVGVSWECNSEMQQKVPAYHRVLELDAEFDRKIKEIQDGDRSINYLAVVMMANQIKLHYSFISNDFSSYKLPILIKRNLADVRTEIMQLKEHVRAMERKGLVVTELRTQYPYLWCYAYQSLLVLLALTQKRQIYSEEILLEVDLLLESTSDGLVELDSILVEVLTLVKTSLGDLKEQRFPSDPASIVDLDNPQFFHDIDFWSNLASSDKSSWSYSLT